MRVIAFVISILFLTGCARYFPQRSDNQPEVLMHYRWHNNLIQQPVAHVQLWNTTQENFVGFTLDICAWDEKGNEIASFRVFKPIDLVAGDIRRFRISLPFGKASEVEVALVEFNQLETQGQSEEDVSSRLRIEEIF